MYTSIHKLVHLLAVLCKLRLGRQASAFLIPLAQTHDAEWLMVLRPTYLHRQCD